MRKQKKDVTNVPVFVNDNMDQEDELKLKAELSLVKAKLDALINLLAKEGILTHGEIEEEVNRVIKKESDE